MAIKKKIIHFKTKNNFQKELDAGNILETSIVFIKDTKEIWTHNEYYSQLPEGLLTKEEAEETYAKQDGTYPELTAGNAQNLQGNFEITSEDAYKPTGGDTSVTSGWEAASIQNIKGNARAWNQLIDKDKNNSSRLDSMPSGTRYICWQTRSYLENNNNRLILNHKYYVSITCTTTEAYITPSDSNIGVATRLGLSEGGNTWGQNTNYSPVLMPNETRTIKSILINRDSRNRSIYFTYGTNDDDTISFKDIMLIDLTLIYGEGNEPSTPEQFEEDYRKWFGKSLEYEEYDEGSIRSVKATGIKTVGFNLSPITEFEGSVASHDWIKPLFKNDCGYKGQIHISFDIDTKGDAEANTYMCILYTDGTYAFIGTSHFIDTNNHCSYLTKEDKQVASIDGAYHHGQVVKITNICINFVWSGKRDGDYEPHWEETTSIPITELTSNGVKIFPDGLKRAGDIYDEIFVENGVTKAIKRVGNVDLGSLDWRYEEDYNRLMSDKPLTDIIDISNGWLFNLLSSNYPIRLEKRPFMSSQGRFIFIYPSKEYTDLQNGQLSNEFKQSLQGSILYYELSEPQEYIIDNFTLPLAYKIDDFGTEQIIQPNDSIAPVITTKYGLNAVDTLRNLPNKLKEIDNKLSNVSSNNETPDWNASEGESGFIKNKPFGEEKESIKLLDNVNVQIVNDSSFNQGQLALIPNEECKTQASEYANEESMIISSITYEMFNNAENLRININGNEQPLYRKIQSLAGTDFEFLYGANITFLSTNKETIEQINIENVSDFMNDFLIFIINMEHASIPFMIINIFDSQSRNINLSIDGNLTSFKKLDGNYLPIVQEKGNAEDKIMSQKAITEALNNNYFVYKHKCTVDITDKNVTEQETLTPEFVASLKNAVDNRKDIFVDLYFDTDDDSISFKINSIIFLSNSNLITLGGTIVYFFNTILTVLIQIDCSDNSVKWMWDHI